MGPIQYYTVSFKKTKMMSMDALKTTCQFSWMLLLWLLWMISLILEVTLLIMISEVANEVGVRLGNAARAFRCL